MRLARAAAVLAGFALLAAAGPALAQQATTVVPKRVIYPGEVIDASQIDEVAFTPRPLGITIAMVPEDVEGKVARRTLLPGRLIPLNFLREAYAVEPGNPVSVVYVSGALTISITGVPLQSGAAGDQIRVRNVDSGAILTGTVMADGTVRVGSS